VKKPHLNGHFVRVLPFVQKHFTRRYISWLNDAEVVRFSEQRHQKHTNKTCQKYIKSFRNTKNQLLAIELKENHHHIGNISILRNMKNGTADLGILIGERKEWGKGYGGEAFGLVLKMLLQDATIRKITAGAMSENKGMIKLACGSGMKIEAVIPKYFYWNRREVDLVYMAKYNRSFRDRKDLS
jgi:RimJ/RimL family protein N-acetyltransferase